MSNGTRFVPKAAKFTGHSDNFQTYGAPYFTSTIKDSGGVQQYLQALPNADGSGAAWKLLYPELYKHYHNLAGGAANAALIY